MDQHHECRGVEENSWNDQLARICGANSNFLNYLKIPFSKNFLNSHKSCRKKNALLQNLNENFQSTNFPFIYLFMIAGPVFAQRRNNKIINNLIKKLRIYFYTHKQKKTLKISDYLLLYTLCSCMFLFIAYIYLLFFPFFGLLF